MAASLTLSAEAFKRKSPDELNRLLDRIRANEPRAMGELYEHVMPWLKLFFRARRLREAEAEDCAHEVILIAVKQIRSGALNNDACLFGYVRTIAARHYINRWRSSSQTQGEDELDWKQPLADLRTGPERELLEREKREIALRVLALLKPKEREILTRFYLWEQDEQTIREAMHLTANQYRLLKSRAKARFGQLGQKQLRRPPLAAGLRVVARKVTAA